MRKPKFEIMTGALPAENNHFSTLIYYEAGEEVRYYELKYRYHGRHRPSAIFESFWNRMIRPVSSPADALTWRARRTLKRSGIKPLELKYMTTAVMEAQDNRPARYRHIVGLKLSSQDFEKLRHKGMLRELFRGDASDKEAQRDALFGLTPLLLRVAKAEAAKADAA